MKTLLTFLFLTILLVTGQSQVSFIDDNMSEGLRPGVSILLPDVNTRFVDSQWKNYIKKYGGKYRWNRREGEHRNEGTSIPNVSPENINVYAVSRESGNNTQFIVWFQEGTQFLSPNKDSLKMDNAANLLNHFALEVAREKLKDDIKEEEKNLSKLENDLSKQERQNEKLHKDIENYKERIAKAEQEIIDNEKQQVDSGAAITSQKARIEKLKEQLSELQ